MEAHAEYLDLAKLAWKDLSSHQLFLPATLGLAIVSLTVILFNLLKPVHASAPRKSPKKKPTTPVGTTKVEAVRRSTRVHKPPVNDDFYSPLVSRSNVSKSTTPKATPATETASPSPAKRTRATRSSTATAPKTAPTATASKAATAATPRRSTRRTAAKSADS